MRSLIIHLTVWLNAKTPEKLALRGQAGEYIGEYLPDFYYVSLPSHTQ
jgi:hypothetical protein